MTAECVHFFGTDVFSPFCCFLSDCPFGFVVARQDRDKSSLDTREKFVKLLKEIQNKPMPAHASPAFQSEMDTRWMALVMLCPKVLRDRRAASYHKDEIEDFDISEEFRVPEWVVPFVMDDYYDEAFNLLINGRPAVIDQLEDPNIIGI